jgi:hypothetical protein
MLISVGMTLPSLKEEHLMSVYIRVMQLSENVLTDLVTTSK